MYGAFTATVKIQVYNCSQHLYDSLFSSELVSWTLVHLFSLIWIFSPLRSNDASSVHFASERQPPRVAAGGLGESQTHHRGHNPRSTVPVDPDDGDGVLGHRQPGRTILEQRVRGQLPNRTGKTELTWSWVLPAIKTVHKSAMTNILFTHFTYSFHVSLTQAWLPVSITLDESLYSGAGIPRYYKTTFLCCGDRKTLKRIKL